MRTVPAEIARPDYATHAEGESFAEKNDQYTECIRCYSPEEIQGIREACRIGREVLDIGKHA